MTPFEELSAEEANKRMAPPPANAILQKAKAIALEHPSKDARVFAANVAAYFRWSAEPIVSYRPVCPLCRTEHEANQLEEYANINCDCGWKFESHRLFSTAPLQYQWR